MPVMEGKALLFKEFGGVDAWPICLATKDPDEIVVVCKAIAPGFGGINLEDISSPRCFEIESRLQAELDIPVFHDDQHGTAIVVLAALVNALEVVGKRLEDVTIVTTGVGAAGVATTDALIAAGARRIIGCDHEGAIYRGRPGARPAQGGLRGAHQPRTGSAARRTRRSRAPTSSSGSPCRARSRREGVRRMAEGAIVFAMANPVPEVEPEAIHDVAAVVATGRSDYPNQINNVLAFPGVFRGALDVRAQGDHVGDEGRCRARDRLRHPEGRARARVHRAERLQPRRHAAGRRGGRRRSGAVRRRQELAAARLEEEGR